jgi:hypothetical protein
MPKGPRRFYRTKEEIIEDARMYKDASNSTWVDLVEFYDLRRAGAEIKSCTVQTNGLFVLVLELEGFRFVHAHDFEPVPGIH